MLLGGLVAIAAGLLPASASAARIGYRTLIPGAHGSDVRTVQVLLRRVVAEPIVVDGEYGPQTTAAALQFETANALGLNGRLTRGEQRLLRTFSTQALAEERAVRAVEQTAAADPAATAPAAAPEAPVTPVAAPVAAAPGIATLNPDGTATAPAGAPPAVAAIIAAGNEIATKPYVYGGGHRAWIDTGYDCSGSVSYALHGAGLVTASAPSGAFMSWGDPGPGTWVTLYSHESHMYMVVAGLRFDTSGAKPSRWQTAQRTSTGFTVRHPPGL
jgi:peptidoglycan hydrolase-like protein with peptidoglycan-binding domain